jgi:hypothetical protein
MPPTADALGYLIGESPLGAPREAELDLATAPAYQLFFSCFLGDVRLSLDGIDFSTRFGWVATLGFAIGFAARVRDLPQTVRWNIHFQEKDEWISLRLDRGVVYVSASYAKGIAVVSHDRLDELARTALRDLVGRLVGEHPRLRRNQALHGQLVPLLGPEFVRSLGEIGG